MSEENTTLVTILAHVRLVQKYMSRISKALEQRAIEHDISKLLSDEYKGFIEVNRVARTHAYGSDEYKASLKGNNVIKLHFSRNSHHPEYYLNGVSDMSLLDIIEMVVDWKAASETYGQTSFEDSISIQKDRFGLSDEQLYLIRLIAKELE